MNHEKLNDDHSLIYDFLYLGRKLNGDHTQEISADDEGFFVRPGYSYWTIGYMITRHGIEKLLHANPLRRMIPVDEFLPIMYGGHVNATLVQMYTDIDRLNALSLRQLIIYPTHYVGDAAYISDTEDSDKVSDKNQQQQFDKAEFDQEEIYSSLSSIDKSYYQGKLISEPQPPPTDQSTSAYYFSSTFSSSSSLPSSSGSSLDHHLEL